MPKSSVSKFATWVYLAAFMVCFAGDANGQLVIVRKVESGDVFHRDRFNIPRSKCANINRPNKCGYYKGLQRSAIDKCKCFCPPRSGTIIVDSGTWTCVQNKAMRRIVGCGFRFVTESPSSFLQIVNRNEWHIFHAPLSGCLLDVHNTQYMGCNGTWLPIHKAAASFELLPDGYDQVARLFSYRIRVRRQKGFSGRIVKVGLTCQPFSGKRCVVMKTNGRTKCKCLGSVVGLTKRSEQSYKKAADIDMMATLPLKISTSPPSKLSSRSRKSNQFTAKSTEEMYFSSPSIKGPNRADEEDATISALLTATAVFIGITILILTIKLFCSPSRDRTTEIKTFLRRRKKAISKGQTSDETRDKWETVSTFDSEHLYAEIDGRCKRGGKCFDHNTSRAALASNAYASVRRESRGDVHGSTDVIGPT